MINIIYQNRTRIELVKYAMENINELKVILTFGKEQRKRIY